MELPGFGVSREVGDEVELPENLFDDFAGVIALAELVYLSHHPRQHAFSLFNRGVRIVLAL